MTVPHVSITQLDGAIGVLSPGGRLLALVGASSAGPLNTPAAFARTQDVIANFGTGPLVEAACHVIDRYRLPVVVIRTGHVVDGAYGALDTDAVDGTSVVTTTADTEPLDDYQVQVEVIAGGTIGVAGITYRYSLDGGSSWSATLPLGTATQIAIPNSGVSFDLAAGTLVTDDVWSVGTVGPHVEQTTPGAAGAVDTSGVTGTSVVTADDTTTEPLDDYEVFFEIVAGGTIGVAGITFKYSLDGGRTMSPTTALGVASTYTIPGSGVTVDFAAGTLVAGDSFSFRTSAPLWDSTDLGAALDALANTAIAWEAVHVVGSIDPTAFDLIDLKVAGMAADADYKWWIGSVRMPNLGEDEATYFASVSAAFASKATTYGALCYGADLLTSSVSGRKYRRPVSFVAAGREISLSEEQNSADVKLGSLVGVSIRDSNGNPVDGLHDEALTPGADDARFYTLRSWKRRAGVFVNQPRIFSAQGSDFQLIPHRRVMNRALEVLHDYFVERLNSPILVDATTGFILESEAIEIETNANARLRAALLDKPKASDAFCVVSRTDNLLSTATLTGEARVVPLAYPTRVALSAGFSNPALNVTTA